MRNSFWFSVGLFDQIDHGPRPSVPSVYVCLVHEPFLGSINKKYYHAKYCSDCQSVYLTKECEYEEYGIPSVYDRSLIVKSELVFVDFIYYIISFKYPIVYNWVQIKKKVIIIKVSQFFQKSKCNKGERKTSIEKYYQDPAKYSSGPQLTRRIPSFW